MRSRDPRSALPAPGSVRRVRCALYTRKSSEEGLEQDFNSLHAQREACEAYVASQRHEGWMLIKTAYDDGGYSGGSMERPGLKKLLADIQSGLIDIVVVYKVDRLTRSLADFAKMVEAFDQHGISFVSVTQAFNTTTSMGRLTLNVLLSFAQFEREVTGERIRDKIAASKRKGMWMGGVVPMGYVAANRTLAIVDKDAAVIRRIFERYVALRSVGPLADELDGANVRTNVFVSASGRRFGGRSFSRGHLYKILSNPIYVGEISHRGERHAGQHPAIIDRETFDAVQAQLAANAHEWTIGSRATEAALLAGLVFDEQGRRLFSSHANKAGKRYRYYAAKVELQYEDSDDEAPRPSDARANRQDASNRAGVRDRAQEVAVKRRNGAQPLRIPAGDLERLILEGLAIKLADPAWLADAISGDEATPDAMRQASAKADLTATELRSADPARQRAALLAIVDRVAVARDAIAVTLKSALTDQPNRSEFGATIRLACRIEPRGRELRLIVPGSNGSAEAKADRPLLKAIARAAVWYDDLKTGRVDSMRAIAACESVGEAYVGQVIKLAFLAPYLVTGMVEQAASLRIDTTDIARGLDLSPDWDQQRVLLA